MAQERSREGSEIKEFTLPREVGECHLPGLTGNVGTLPGKGREWTNLQREKKMRSDCGGQGLRTHAVFENSPEGFPTNRKITHCR